MAVVVLVVVVVFVVVVVVVVENSESFDPFLRAMLGPKSLESGPKSDSKCDVFFDRFEDRFCLLRFGANLAPSWPPKPSQNGAN